MNTKAAAEPADPMHTLSDVAAAFRCVQREVLNKSVPVVRVGTLTVEYLAEKGSREIVGWIENAGKYTGNVVYFKVDYGNQLMVVFNDRYPWHGTTLPQQCTPAQLLKIMTGCVLGFARKSGITQAAAEPEPSLDGTGGQVWRKTVKLLKHLKRIGEFEVVGDPNDNYAVALRNQHGQVEFDVNYNVCLPANKHTGRNLLDVVAYLPEGPVLVLEAPLPDSVPAITKAVVAFAHKNLGKSTHAAAEPPTPTSTADLFARLYKRLSTGPVHGKHNNISYTLNAGGSSDLSNRPVLSIVLRCVIKEHGERETIDTTVFNMQGHTVTRGFLAAFTLPPHYTSTKDLILGMLRVACGDWQGGVPAHVKATAEPEQSVEQLWGELVKYTAAKKHFQVHNQPASVESQHGALVVGVGSIKCAWFRLNESNQISFGVFSRHHLGAEETAALLRNRNRALVWMARSVDIGKIAPLNGGV